MPREITLTVPDDDGFVEDLFAAFEGGFSELVSAGRDAEAEALRQFLFELRDSGVETGIAADIEARGRMPGSLQRGLHASQLGALVELCGGSRAQALDWWMVDRGGATGEARAADIREWAGVCGVEPRSLRNSLDRARERIVDNMTAELFAVVGHHRGMWDLMDAFDEDVRPDITDDAFGGIAWRDD